MTLPLLLAALLQPPLAGQATDTLVARIYAVVLDTSQIRPDRRMGGWADGRVGGRGRELVISRLNPRTLT